MGSDQLAPIWRRTIGRLVDLAIWGAFLVVISALTVQTASDGTQSNPTWVEPLAFVPIFVYEALMLAMRGQTLGKMAVHTRVVTSERKAVAAWPAIVRSAITWSFTVGLMLSVWEYIWIVGWGLLAMTFAPALIDPRRRTLADLAAGTQVGLVEPMPSAAPGVPKPFGA
jgi:uncharacterized RDD family membrane protein YckC